MCVEERKSEQDWIVWRLVIMGTAEVSGTAFKNYASIRIDYGPGYRVYFGQVNITVILLLCGGDKATQARDIETAKSYWQVYGRR